ncbi:MAG: hypothetical protein E6G20_11685 [Actinobacteria bacterium]|nr:MAG: hypothetical protein E6G20_11685 [Actinomycetota bacterium]
MDASRLPSRIQTVGQLIGPVLFMAPRSRPIASEVGRSEDYAGGLVHELREGLAEHVLEVAGDELPKGRDRGSSSPRGRPAEPGARLRRAGWLIAAAPSFLGLLAGLPRVFVAAILCVEAPDEVVHVRRHGLIFASRLFALLRHTPLIGSFRDSHERRLEQLVETARDERPLRRSSRVRR